MPNKKEIVDVINFNLKETFISDVNNYRFTAQASLVAWFGFGATLSDKSDNSSSISSLAYRTNGSDNNGDAVLSSEAFNVSSPTYPTYNVARFNQTNIPTVSFGSKRNAKVVYSSAPTPITFGGGSGDNPFSVSIWAKVQPSIGSNAPGWMFAFGQSGGSDYYVQWESTGYLNFVVRQNSNGAVRGTRIQLSDYATTYANSWHHYAFTYDGNESSPGLKIYINGVLQSTATTTAGAYSGMTATGTTLFIGSKHNENDNFNGFLSQLSIFSTELNLENIKAIYEGASIGSYQDKTTYFSGELSNPGKDIVKTLDKKIRHIHGQGLKKGTYTVQFDDENTIDFLNRKLIGSIGVEENTSSTPFLAANTYSDYGIKITSTYGSSFITNQVRNSFEGDKDPFNEFEKFFLDSSFSKTRKTSIDVFDQVGLEENTNEKSIIEISLNPLTDTTFGIEQGVGSAAKNDLMVYWNNDLKRWEKLGGTVLSPASEDTIDTLLSGGRIGFAPTEGLTIPNKKSNFKAAFKNFGLPVDNFGFPSHPKYHATGSQYVEMKNFIKEPFVVEKVVYELDAKLYVDKDTADVFEEDDEPTAYGKSGRLSSYFTFFILNQKENDKVTNFKVSKIFNQDDSSASSVILETDSLGDDQVNIETNRDLVTYMQVAVYSNDSESVARGSFIDGENATSLDPHLGFLTEGYGRSVNISGSNYIASSTSFDSDNHAFNGKMILSGTVLDDIKHESMGINFKIGSAKYAISDLGNARNPSKIEEVLKSRRFECASIFDEKDEKSSFRHSLYPDISKAAIEGITTKRTHYSSKEKPGPYILMPSDRLVFGWQSPVSMNMSALGDSNPSSQMIIKAGTGKLKLYGSFLRNKKSYYPESLFYSNNMISKVLKDSGCDQYQIETRSRQEGNYNSQYVTGVIPSRIASSKTGAGSNFNSSIHFVQLVDSTEEIYDSYLPDILGFYKRAGVSIVNNKVENLLNLNKIIGHKFNNRLYVDGEKRQKSTKIIYPGVSTQEVMQMTFSKGFEGISSENLTDSVSGSRSMYYGMHSYNVSKNKAFYNTRHFGHLSDQISQRKIYAFEKDGKVFYPVKKIFVSKGQRIDPMESTAQNVSLYSTSSFPFIEEGVPTQRTDDTNKIDNIVIFPEMPGTDILNK